MTYCSRLVDCGDVSVLLKDRDARLSKSLTLAKFCVALGAYRDILRGIPRQTSSAGHVPGHYFRSLTKLRGSLFYECINCFPVNQPCTFRSLIAVWTAQCWTWNYLVDILLVTASYLVPYVCRLITSPTLSEVRTVDPSSSLLRPHSLMLPSPPKVKYFRAVHRCV